MLTVLQNQYWLTVRILSFRTNVSERTVQTRISLLQHQGFHWLQFNLSFVDITHGLNYRMFRTNVYIVNSGQSGHSLLYTVVIRSFQTDRPLQTVQTLIRLLLEEQSDQGLHCLPFHLHLLDIFPMENHL